MKKLLKNKRGAALMEYALLVGLIAVVATTAAKPFGEKLKSVLNNATAEADKFDTTPTTP